MRCSGLRESLSGEQLTLLSSLSLRLQVSVIIASFVESLTKAKSSTVLAKYFISALIKFDLTCGWLLCLTLVVIN